MKVNLLNFRKSTLFILYVLGFILSFTSSIPAYVNSSFLKSLIGESAIGIFYTIGSILSLIVLISIPKLLKKYGNYKVMLFSTILCFIDFLAISFVPNIFLVLFFFMISGSIATIIYFNLDVFIEHNSSDIKTGSIRSTYLTCLNLAWLFSPWIAGILVGESSYKNVYIVITLIMIPIIFIVSSSFRDFKDPDYKSFNMLESLKSLNINKNIKNIWISNFLLQLFYLWMIIYTPIYLNAYVGFSWGTIGIMFTIMLLPFVFLQIPLGYLADKKIGEKEILTVGFILLGIFTAIIPFINSNNFIIWTTVLFLGRLGAAMVGLMTDVYFFKKVTDENLNFIDLYRTTAPLAYIIFPIIITVFLYFLPLSYFYYVVGLLMIFGLKYSLAIEDTK